MSAKPIQVYGPTGEEDAGKELDTKTKPGSFNFLRSSGGRGASPVVNRRHSNYDGLSPDQPGKDLFHNFLHPMDFMKQRKSRSRATSECSEVFEDNSSRSPSLAAKIKQKYFTKPDEKNAWPVYQPQARPRAIQYRTQVSCPEPSARRNINANNQQVIERHKVSTKSSSSSFSSCSESSSFDDENYPKNNPKKTSKNTVGSSLPKDFGKHINVSSKKIPGDNVPFNPNIHSFRDSSSVRYEMEHTLGPRFGVECLPQDSKEKISENTIEKEPASSRVKSDISLDAEERKVSATEKLYSIYDEIVEKVHFNRALSKTSENDSTGSSIGEKDHNAMLFKDSSGVHVDPLLDKNLKDGSVTDGINSYVKFFKYYHCVDLIPVSGRIVAFDTALKAKEAFYGLQRNDVRAALLWDQVKKDYVGILTITDFIRILQNFYADPNRSVEELEEQSLETWRSILKIEGRPLISIEPDASLYEAIRMLIDHKIHRLPVLDHCTGNVLYIITHKRIMKCLYLYINELPKPARLQQTLEEIQIGTYKNIQTAGEGTTIIEALNKFAEHRISALPIVDHNEKLIDIYAKFDVIRLAAKDAYKNPNITLMEANVERKESFDQVYHCRLSETLETIMNRIVFADVHRLVVVDKEDKVIGVISISDILKELILRPCGDVDPLPLKSQKLSARRISESETGLIAESIHL